MYISPSRIFVAAGDMSSVLAWRRHTPFCKAQRSRCLLLGLPLVRHFSTANFAELLHWARLPSFELLTVSSTRQLACEVSTLTEHEGTVGVVKAGLASECVQQEAVDILSCLTNASGTCLKLCKYMLQRVSYLIDVVITALKPSSCFSGVAGLAVDLCTMTRHEDDPIGGHR